MWSPSLFWIRLTGLRSFASLSPQSFPRKLCGARIFAENCALKYSLRASPFARRHCLLLRSQRSARGAICAFTLVSKLPDVNMLDYHAPPGLPCGAANFRLPLMQGELAPKATEGVMASNFFEDTPVENPLHRKAVPLPLIA